MTIVDSNVHQNLMKFGHLSQKFVNLAKFVQAKPDVLGKNGWHFRNQHLKIS